VPSFVLASASPRRAELLAAAGFTFTVDVADVDESVHDGEAPATYVRRVADAKAQAVAARHAGRLVLAADTTVVVDGDILGKPADTADARRMLRRLSGRAHEVMTAVTLIDPASGLQRALAVTTVHVAPLHEAEIDWYVASGEPLDKAGGYAIQGLASRFVTGIDGSYSNVVGLPIAHVYGLMRAAAGRTNETRAPV
jgi:septum formation protein